MNIPHRNETFLPHIIDCQTLGVIGYSLLPLIVTGFVLTVIGDIAYVDFIIKVGLHTLYHLHCIIAIVAELWGGVGGVQRGVADCD